MNNIIKDLEKRVKELERYPSLIGYLDDHVRELEAKVRDLDYHAESRDAGVMVEKPRKARKCPVCDGHGRRAPEPFDYYLERYIKFGEAIPGECLACNASGVIWTDG